LLETGKEWKLAGLDKTYATEVQQGFSSSFNFLCTTGIFAKYESVKIG